MIFQGTSLQLINALMKSMIDRGHREGGLTARSKNFKTPFFKRYRKILSRGYTDRSRTSPFFFFLKYLNKCSQRDVQNFG